MKTIVWIWGLVWCFNTSAQVYLKPDEALKVRFPKASITKEIVLLSADEVNKIATSAKETFEERMIPVFWVKEGQKTVASGVVLSRRIKHQNQSALYVLSNTGKITSIELISFGEPIEYQPKPDWYDQFKGMGPDDPTPKLGENIRVVTGSTLTAQSFLSGTRLALAIWQSRLAANMGDK